MLEKFLERTEFESYEDLKANYKVRVPAGFNFAYDVVDEWAVQDPAKNALLWCTDDGDRRMYTFRDLSELSNRCANFFLRAGIRKGDRVMMMLKQRPEAWICILALCKIGAVCIPATYQLTVKDIVYRCNLAKVRMILSVDEPELVGYIASARPECETLGAVAVVGDRVPEGMLDLRAEIAASSPELERIPNALTDPMLMYFSSGTTGMPKMILHDYTYPVGHIITAKYWQHCEDGKLHLTMSDSGWAKFAWGKIYGQWICGAVIVAYDNEKFNAHNTLELIQEINAQPLDTEKMSRLPGMVVYVVKDGDSLWNIGKKYYVTVDTLRSLNELEGDTLVPGQKLLVVKGG